MSFSTTTPITRDKNAFNFYTIQCMYLQGYMSFTPIVF